MTFSAQLRARAAGIKARLIFPEGDDPRVRRAAELLIELEIADALVLRGDQITETHSDHQKRIAALLRERRPHAVRDGLHALDLARDPLRFAAGMVALGEADGCIAGVVAPTADVIRAALWLIGMRPGIASLSAAMYHGLRDGRVLTYTDIAVTPTPDPAQLAAAAIAAADDRIALVGDEPKVAFLSFSTHGSASGPEVDRVRSALALFRAARPSVAADGEMQLDAALVPAVAAAKCPQSSVAGYANVLVFPSLDAGNIAYKLTERLAGASAAGPLLQGLMKPMSDLSRGAEVDDIVDVGAMVALQAAARSYGTLQPR